MVGNMSNLVSVIMTVYNESEELVTKSLNSIINQTYKKIEIIIVLDNPNNHSIKELLLGYSDQYENIKLIVNKDNLGVAKSLNLAFDLSNGNYIARMDSDDVSNDIRIEKQVNILEKYKEYDLVSSNCKKIDEEDNVIGEVNLKVNNEKIKKLLLISNFLIHPSWVMRRSLFEELNGYRNFECSQDYDFLLRMMTKDKNIYLLDEKLIDYRVRENSISTSRAFKQYLIANYIKSLYYERNRNSGNDSFSNENLNDYLIRNKLATDELKFKKSKKIVDTVKSEKHIIKKFLLTLYAFSFSKFSRHMLINKIQFSVNKII